MLHVKRVPLRVGVRFLPRVAFWFGFCRASRVLLHVKRVTVRVLFLVAAAGKCNRSRRVPGKRNGKCLARVLRRVLGGGVPRPRLWLNTLDISGSPGIGSPLY